jgi:hypothetical protein
MQIQADKMVKLFLAIRDPDMFSKCNTLLGHFLQAKAAIPVF